MTFTIGREKDVSVFSMDGELTVGNRQDLKRGVLDAVANGDRKILIDFAQTSYIDSSGLGVLVSLSKRIREAGGRVEAGGAQRGPRDALRAHPPGHLV